MSSKDPKDNAGEPWNSKTSEKFNSKLPGEYLDPCQEAASRSLKCLHRNGGDREMCTDYFQAYRDCKQQWLSARKEAKLAAKQKEGKSWFS
ncbi:cysteine alpha-hairpin motif superfamily [Rhexocercosporidium sp. MPI-PUGE-AT-0058]|nr:cysteine alpha-hairpin motif superfamily [Rhexocercosporidium sp. MPI-PUGE-AT-0058]